MRFDLHRASCLGVFVGLPLIAGLALTPAVLHAQDAGTRTGPLPSDEITEPADPGWNRVDDSATDSSQVLELPQVVSSDDNATDAVDPEDSTAMNDAEASAAESNYGDLNDYENQQVAAGELPQSPIQPRTVVFPPTFGGSRFIVLPPPTVILVRPRGLSPLPPTSPLLTMPRGAGPVFGGWWHRSR
jgi:hypothetical protein